MIRSIVSIKAIACALPIAFGFKHLNCIKRKGDFNAAY
jgi:hypothetical protein